MKTTHTHQERLELYLYELTTAIIRMTHIIIETGDVRLPLPRLTELVIDANNSIERLNHLKYEVTQNPDDIIDSESAPEVPK